MTTRLFRTEAALVMLVHGMTWQLRAVMAHRCTAYGCVCTFNNICYTCSDKSRDNSPACQSPPWEQGSQTNKHSNNSIGRGLDILWKIKKVRGMTVHAVHVCFE